MTRLEKKHRQLSWRIGCIGALVLVLCLVAFPFVVFSAAWTASGACDKDAWPIAGQIGDIFGSLNAFVSGATLIGVILGLTHQYYQTQADAEKHRKELHLAKMSALIASIPALIAYEDECAKRIEPHHKFKSDIPLAWRKKRVNGMIGVCEAAILSCERKIAAFEAKYPKPHVSGMTFGVDDYSRNVNNITLKSETEFKLGELRTILGHFNKIEQLEKQLSWCHSQLVPEDCPHKASQEKT